MQGTNQEKTIMVVDDSANDTELLLRTFRQVGVDNTVYTFDSADAALEYLGKPNTLLPTIMLLDLRMPGKDGFHVLQKVKTDSRLKQIVVIVLTTSSDFYDIRVAYELGANSFLTKPLDLGEFRAMVAAFHSYWVLRNQPLPPEGRHVPRPEEGERDQI